jgi:hypothetical protein
MVIDLFVVLRIYIAYASFHYLFAFLLPSL